MYPSELEHCSERWIQTEVQREEYSCPMGSTIAPSGVHQRPMYSMYRCTVVQIYGEYKKMLP